MKGDVPGVIKIAYAKDRRFFYNMERREIIAKVPVCCQRFCGFLNPLQKLLNPFPNFCKSFTPY